MSQTEVVAGTLAPEVAAPIHPPRFPAFDGLRAMAALMVIVVHTSFASGLTPKDHAVGRYTSRLEVGVAVFFLISGFLLYRPFVVAHLSAAPKPRTGAFWLRRILRIVPAFWLALFVQSQIFHGYPGLGPGGWTAELWQYSFTWIYSPQHTLKGITSGWSLCVEMTFYLFIPFYAAWIGRRRAERTVSGRLRAEMYGLAALVLVSFAWRISTLPLQRGHSAYFVLSQNWLPAFFDLFAMGMFLAVVSAYMHHQQHEFRWFSSWWFPWVSWALALASFWAVSNLGLTVNPLHTAGPIDLLRQTLYGFVGFFLLLPAIFGRQDRGLIRRFLCSWPMASLGVISYGIYLWHVPWIFQILKVGHLRDFSFEFWGFTFAVLALSCISASLSYFIIEKPALRLKNSIAWWRRSGPGGTAKPPDSTELPGDSGTVPAEAPEPPAVPVLT